MHSATDKKPGISLKKKASESTPPLANNVPANPAATSEDRAIRTSAEKFREAIKSVGADRKELVRNAIDNIKPGRTFDSCVVRQINKLETKRNRLIVAHFAWLLKKNPTYVDAIVHQIIEL